MDDVAESWAATPIPAEIGRYRILAPLGTGGAGSVHAASAAGEHGFAIKLMLPQWASNEVMVRRFEREIETIAELDHPNVIRILEHGRLPDGRLWYAMPRLSGHDVDTLVVAHGRLAVDDVRIVMDAVCGALAAAHALGVVHRDLKGSNVFIGDERPPRITLLDFGAVRLDQSQQGQGLTAAGAVVGTPTSMAPEQVVGLEVDARTDIYAAGMLMYRMLTGRYAFDEGAAEEIMLQQLTAQPQRPSTFAAIPPELDAIVMRCLEKRPEDRFQSAAELRAAIRDARGVAEAPAGAVAIHVELVGAAELDERIGLDGLALAAERLIAAGFELAIGVGGTVLGVRELASAREASVREAHDVAAALHAELVDRCDAALDPRIVVHVGSSDVLGPALTEARLQELERVRRARVHAGVQLTAFAQAALRCG